MNKLTKVGCSALCGSLAAISAANAGDLTVTGGADLTWISMDDEATGNPIGIGSNLTFKGSGELDNGWTFDLTVAMLNQDAYLQEGCLDKLLSVQRKNPDYGVLSPIHLNGKGDKLDENFSNYMVYKNNPHFYSDFILKNPLQQVYQVPFVNAAGWLLSKEVLETVGGFDPLFFHYGEDDNFCQRVRYHGYKVGVVPTAFLHHDRDECRSGYLLRIPPLFVPNLR